MVYQVYLSVLKMSVIQRGFMKKIFLLFLPLLFFSFGCRTPEYYQDQAVQKARSFLLKRNPQLTYEENSYIRFNKPVIVHSNIIGGADSLDASTITGDLNQIQIIWQVPGQEKFYSVWGVCSSGMRDYCPERIFVRKFTPLDINRQNALKRARAYIIGSLFATLSVEDYNDLRFRDPEISYSNFELEKSIMPKKDEFQFAFVWQLKSKPDTKFVVIGNGRKNLADFTPVSGSELSTADVTAKLAAPYKTLAPEDLKKAAKINAAEAEKTAVKKAAEALPEPPQSDSPQKADEKIAQVEKSLSDNNAADSALNNKKAVVDEKIIDDLPEAPELDTENDLKEPEK